MPLYKQGLVFYLIGGIGAYYGKPKADLFNGSIDLANRYYFSSNGSVLNAPNGEVIHKDGIYETDLAKWKTEAEGIRSEDSRTNNYKYINVGFPVGAGVRYGLNRLITFSAEFDYYIFMTDYLDDVSTRYATYDELSVAFPDRNQFELAKYISDPTGRGTDGTIGARTSRRGNPALKDAFTFVSLEVAYNFTLKPKGIYGQTARR
jgi:hypothetical protein